MAMGETMNPRGVKKLFVLVPNYAAGKDMAGRSFIFSLNHGAVTKLPSIASADLAALILRSLSLDQVLRFAVLKRRSSHLRLPRFCFWKRA